MEIRLNLDYAYSREKLFSQALAEMRKAVSISPDDEQAQLSLGNLYLLTNDRQAAIEQYAAMKTANPQLAEKIYQAIYNGRIVTVLNK